MGILDSLKNVLGNRGKEGAAEAPEAAGEDAAATSPDEATTYTVQSGDTLWRIAQAHYGDGDLYMKLFEANRDVLDAPEQVMPGQQLSLPPKSELA